MEAVRRNSKKRRSIYELLCASRSHPSAEQLYSALKSSMPELSLGTVYRNLGVLQRDGLIVSVGRVGGEERYDADTGFHPHFICSCCGAVSDLASDMDIENYRAAAEDETGGRVLSCSLSFYGLCKECEKRQKASQL